MTARARYHRQRSEPRENADELRLPNGGAGRKLNMSDAVTRVSVEIEGDEISFETGKLAKQASGAVVVRSSDTMVLCTATAGNLRDVDFLPLTVDVKERMYAAGKIPGSFFKREGRAGEKATLSARLIDRPIRPLFPKGWRYETQLVEQGGKEKIAVEQPQVDPDFYEQIKSSHGEALDSATQVVDKLERQEASKLVEEQVLTQYAGDPEAEDYAARRAAAQLAFDEFEKTLIRERIAVQKKRPDGRTSDEIRPISIEVGVAPRTHGSALFTRGQTQALSVVALGTTREEMRLDTLGLETSKRYFHHYHVPPFSVGHAG